MTFQKNLLIRERIFISKILNIYENDLMRNYYCLKEISSSSGSFNADNTP